MKDNFTIQDWQYSQLIKEGQKFEAVDMKGLASIYNFLKEKLKGPAEEAELRMSIFEQEFPTASSFMIEYDKVADDPISKLDENNMGNIDKIEILHVERTGMIYKIMTYVDGERSKLSKEELDNLISSIIGEEVKIPERYNEEEFQSIKDKLLAQDIEIEYNDLMDIS